MKRVVCGILICIQMIFFLTLPCRVLADSPTDPGELYAKSACLLDGDSGRVLWGKEENAALPMASTTKIMTCILALENGKGKCGGSAKGTSRRPGRTEISSGGSAFFINAGVP